MKIDDLWMTYEQAAAAPNILATSICFVLILIGMVAAGIWAHQEFGGIGWIVLLGLFGGLVGAVLGLVIGGSAYMITVHEPQAKLVQSVRDRALTEHDAYLSEEALDAVIFGESDEEAYYTVGGTFSGSVDGEEAIISLNYDENTKSLDVLTGDPGSGNPGTMESIF